MTNTESVRHPKLSVITVVRNGMPYVEQTIDSVLGQHYSNLEYIVIDGGSTDGSVEVIKSRESRIAKWVSEKDEGIADAFNKGLSFATGDYLLFLNSDDALATPHVLEEIAGKIVENEFPALIYGDFDCLDRISGEIMYHGRVIFSPSKFKYGHVLPHPCLFASRAYFDKYGKFDTGFKIAMDYEWLLRGGRKERVVHVPILVTNVRAGGVSAQNPSMAVEEIILALRKNEYFSNKFSEFKTRGYFSIRFFLRRLLMCFGFYGALRAIKNKVISVRRTSPLKD